MMTLGNTACSYQVFTKTPIDGVDYLHEIGPVIFRRRLGKEIRLFGNGWRYLG